MWGQPPRLSGGAKPGSRCEAGGQSCSIPTKAQRCTLTNRIAGTTIDFPDRRASSPIGRNRTKAPFARNTGRKCGHEACPPRVSVCTPRRANLWSIESGSPNLPAARKTDIFSNAARVRSSYRKSSFACGTADNSVANFGIKLRARRHLQLGWKRSLCGRARGC
jgi:hypothetical protein